MKKSFFRVCSVFALLLLLSHPVLACEGAKTGLVLWSQVVLPNLLPFMICSNVIVSLDAVNLLVFPVRRLLHEWFCLSAAGSYVLVSGLLCGYPMGAKTCSEFMDSGRISGREGKYLAAICNHPSPMFLMGYVISQLSGGAPLWLVLGSLYLPLFPLAALARRIYGVTAPFDAQPAPPAAEHSFDDSLMASCEVMVKIGGYIMLFSILATYILRLPFEQPALKAGLLGVVEITTGIQYLAGSIPGLAGALAICAVTAFGGFSGVFQTKSVIKNAGLSIRHYIAWKAVHSAFTAVLFVLLSQLLPVH